MFAGSIPVAARSEDLLDPAILTRPKAPAAATAAGGPASSPRQMAAAVVSSLESLTRLAASRVEDLDKLRKQVQALNAKVSGLREHRDSVLSEYRAGLFCSGCGKTKSQILAVGDKFPHPGQSIVRPTAEQIRAKERELQAPIDSLEKELLAGAKRQMALAREKSEALEQIDQGVALWHTSIGYDALLFEKNAQAAERAHKDQVAKAGAQKPRAEADAAWARTRRELQEAKTRSSRANSTEQDQINSYLQRGPLERENLAQATLGFPSTRQGFNELGGLYRMGALGLDQDTIPRVEAFVKAFQRETMLAPPGSLPQPPLQQRLKEQLRELIKCDVEDPTCGDRRNGGSGRRG